MDVPSCPRCCRVCLAAARTLLRFDLGLTPDTTRPHPHPSTTDAFALREAYNDASYFKDEGVRAFKLGVLSLEERAQVCAAGAPWFGCPTLISSRVHLQAAGIPHM